MAKRKNAAALFEVIHSDKRFGSSRAVRTQWPSPLGWLRRRAEARSAATESRSGKPPEPSRLWKLLPSIPRLAMSLDPDRQVVSFRLSYTTALIGAFAIFAVVALAFVVGKQMHRRVGPALAEQTTEELRSGPAQGDVLDVAPENPPMAMASEAVPAARNAPVTPTNRVGSAKGATGGAQAAFAGARPTWSQPAPPTTSVDINQKRTVNLYYVLVQSYPAAEKKLAEDACQLLNSRGVLCTIEYDTFYAPKWYSIIGVAGFDRTRNSPDYDRYVERIEQISNEFAGKSKFKKFEPKPFRWRESTKGNG